MSNIVLFYKYIQTSLACYLVQILEAIQCYILIEAIILDCKYIVKIRCYEFLLAIYYLCNAIYKIALEYNYNCKRICKNCNLKR